MFQLIFSVFSHVGTEKGLNEPVLRNTNGKIFIISQDKRSQKDFERHRYTSKCSILPNIKR